jgi:HSP20 family protein
MFGSLTHVEGSLYDQFRRMEQELDELFGRGAPLPGLRAGARGAFPAVNVGATAEKVDVYLFAAGLDPQSLDVSIQQNLLTVSGSRPSAQPENANYYRRERHIGDFRRVVTLPEDCDPERVEAKYTDGILQVSVQRREASKPRQIQIKHA